MNNVKKFLNLRINIKNQYLLFLLIISIVFTCVCFSYALFTTSTIKNNAVSIVTGNLNTLIQSDDLDENKQVIVGANSTKYITLKLTNPNSINAKFNLYYSSTDDLSNVSIGYLYGTNTPPTIEGYVLTKYETNDSSKEYTIIIENNSSNNIILTLGSSAGLANDSLDFPTNTSPITKVKYDTYMNGTLTLKQENNVQIM